MDRVLIYQGAVPLEEDLLNTNRNALIGMGLLMLDIFGTATVVGGLPCTPTAPGSLNVLVGPGRIYALEVVDQTAYSSLAADTVDDIVKQGINLASTTLSCPAPGTVGFSTNYLIEAIFEEQDTTNVVLSYYNSASPGNPLSGPGGNNAAQPTKRQGIVSLQAKAGIPAATGTQTTPAVDSGYVPLYVVTVPFGLTAIAAGNISVYPGAPFITGAFLTQPLADQRYLKLSGGVLTGALTGTSGIFTGLTVNGTSVQNAAVLTSGLVNAAQLGTGTPAAGKFLNGANAWNWVDFSNLTGSIANGQVPVGAVTQWQTSLSISGSQVSGPVAQANTIANSGGFATFHWVGQNGQPQWLWGSNDSANFYVWNPSNFNVNSVQGLAPSVATVANSLVARDGSGFIWGNIEFSQLVGSIANSQVPSAAVTQWQGSLAIAWGQITGTKNADELQGFTASTAAAGSTVVLRDANGYGWFAYLNQSSGQNENPAISQVMVTNASDNFLRKAGLAYFHEQAMLTETIAAWSGTPPASGAPGQVWEFF